MILMDHKDRIESALAGRADSLSLAETAGSAMTVDVAPQTRNAVRMPISNRSALRRIIALARPELKPLALATLA
ncbi:MAG: hypothetical protein ACI9U2_002268, partial [Bradymonadia bacterium]